MVSVRYLIGETQNRARKNERKIRPERKKTSANLASPAENRKKREESKCHTDISDDWSPYECLV